MECLNASVDESMLKTLFNDQDIRSYNLQGYIVYYEVQRMFIIESPISFDESRKGNTAVLLREG